VTGGDAQGRLDAGAVDLWCVALAPDPDGTDRAMLSDEELARAARFVRERDRDRYVAAHAALRRVLARYLGARPRDLRFGTGERGRPAILSAPQLDFNLSHSGALALIGIAASGPIGVDIEEVRPVADLAALARRHFTPEENAALDGIAPGTRDRGFLSCWTRKEACLKALGLGLSVSTRGFDVGVGPSPRRLSVPGPQLRIELLVTSVEVHAGAVAAIATADPAGIRAITHCAMN
jgi:4'-phosphopantetheinyl transferase